jgi:large subunit ribosomal protein L7/L12
MPASRYFVANAFVFQSRTFAVAKHSWAEDHLEKQGERLAPTDREQVHLTRDKIEKTPDHIKVLAEDVLRLNVLDLRSLLETMQDRMGIEGNQLHVGGGGGGGGGSAGGDAEVAETVKEKEFYEVKMSAYDAKSKLKIIKEVRAATGLGLKETKELVEREVVVLKDGMTKEEADAFCKLLTELGAKVEVN